MNTAKDSNEREEKLASLFNLPYLQGVAKRIHKQMISQGETEAISESSPGAGAETVLQEQSERAHAGTPLDDALDQIFPDDGANYREAPQGEQPENFVPEEVSALVSTLSDKMAEVSSEEFDDFVGQLQSSIDITSNLQMTDSQEPPVDLEDESQQCTPEEYAAYLGISPKDLEAALEHENIASLDDLYQFFTEDQDSSGIQMANFDVFVKCFVQSYLDEKNEEKLLGLIGVSAQTGKQKLNTPYAKLLSEIFMPEVGGFFLKDTQNPNYNCFNVGNVIQEQLLELDERQRVSYLENLLALLRKRDSILPRSKQIINSSIVKKYYIDILPNPQELAASLERYLADIAIFRLGFVNYAKLPNNIASLVIPDIYDCLYFVTGFPADSMKKIDKLLLVFQKLSDNEPLLFHSKYRRI